MCLVVEDLAEIYEIVTLSMKQIEGGTYICTPTLQSDEKQGGQVILWRE